MDRASPIARQPLSVARQRLNVPRCVFLGSGLVLVSSKQYVLRGTWRGRRTQNSIEPTSTTSKYALVARKPLIVARQRLSVARQSAWCWSPRNSTCCEAPGGGGGHKTALSQPALPQSMLWLLGNRLVLLGNAGHLVGEYTNKH